MSRTGFDLVRASYYSPIPAIGTLDPALWDEPAPMPGIAWDLDAQARFVTEELGPHVGAWSAPPGYAWPNDSFAHADARLLDAVVRWARPARVLELGSGRSSLIIGAVIGDETEYRLVDPYPNKRFLPQVRRQPTVRAVSTFDLPVQEIAWLQAGDLLFADTTHAVKVGGDVGRLVLELLPLVAAGVIVHIHDIFRPFPYPREFYEAGMFWQEQELVQAMLQDNPTWEILASVHGLWRLRGPQMQAVLPEVTDGATAGSSLWLRRLSRSSAGG